MRKKAFAAIGVIALGAGSAWIYTGYQFEKQINRGLEFMKDPASFVVLSYDEVKINKWLFNASLKNPTLIVRLPSGKEGEAAPVPALYTSKLDGSLTASTLPWSAHTTFTFSGNSLNEINLGERLPFKSQGEDAGFNVKFNLCHKPFWYLHSYDSLLDFALHGLRGFLIKADKTLLTSASKEGQPLFSSGPSEVKMKWDIDAKDNVQIEVAAKIKDQQFHEHLGRILQVFSAYTLLGKDQYDSSFNVKFNFGDFREFLEEALKEGQAKSFLTFLSTLSNLPDLDLKIPKSSSKNATGSRESKMTFSNKKGKELELEYEGAFHYTDQWRPYFLKTLKTAFMQQPEAQQLLLGKGADLEKILEAFLPYRNSLTVEKLEYKMKANPKDQEAALKVKYFLNKQGVKLDLEGRLKDMKVKGSIKIYDYEKCFHDVATYAKRALEALETKEFAGQVDYYHQTALNLIHQLADIETDDGVKVAKIELDMEPAAFKGKVGKKDLTEFMPLVVMMLVARKTLRS